MLSRVLVVAGSMMALSAQAAVYRCEANGRVSFGDKACHANAPAFVPKATLTVLPAGPSRDLAGEFAARVERGRQARDRADQAWRQRFEARKLRDEKVRNGRVGRRVVKGMSAADVRHVLGAPGEVVRNEDKGGESERWSYGGDGGEQATVTLRGGEVIAVRTKTGEGGGGRRKQ